MNRRLILAMTAALACAAPLAAGSPAQAATGCAIQPYGLIGARWAELGGETGKLGCPTTGERDIYVNNVGWAGRRQTFARGQMAWSPKQGPNMVVAAWSSKGYAYFDWKTTAPRSYDKFIVRWTSAADPHGAQEDFVGGTRGRAWTRVRTSSGYRWNVEGCDTGVFGSSCKQGWTISVTG
ncbi:LGFP repeat-containing protein [Nonomuraea sp. LPB2021202275-12-8]|uniref:LGFP repeat-containing protein n=1 Tax=Nonomuraea sp. LPB2021202275-12-8 TaxID=3120159 RepID=UPI00300C0E68